VFGFVAASSDVPDVAGEAARVEAQGVEEVLAAAMRKEFLLDDAFMDGGGRACVS